MRATVLALVGIGVGALIAELSGSERAAIRPPVMNVDRHPVSAIRLVDHSGSDLQWQALSRRLRLVYFGYTFCPDICPTDLVNIAGAVTRLHDRGIDVLPVFVTVDPARDDPTVLAEYVGHFHPDLLGLTGETGEISDLATAFKVQYGKAPGFETERDYLMEHSSFVYLVGADGSLMKVLQGSSTAAELEARVADAVGSSR